MSDYLLGFDEINRLEFKEYTFDELCDLLYKKMRDAYVLGYRDEPEFDYLEHLIFIDYDGKDPFDLLNEAYSDNDTTRIRTIFENEYHRMYNAGAYDYGKAHYRTKQWVTMQDDKVRDTHNYLEGIEIPVEAEFITYDGDGALYPGGFSNASNNVNCRCVLEYK